jgi:hypothetical protein
VAYARNPIAQVPVDQFLVRGGYLFADDAHRNLWNADLNNLQPRLGFTYKLSDKTMARGGVGLFVQPFDTAPNVVNQTGFSRSTPIALVSPDQLRVLGNLTTPHSGELLQPVGSSLGLRTNLGNNVGAATSPYVLLDRKNAQYWRYTLGVQRALPGDVVFEVTYTGQKGQNLSLTGLSNAVPRQYLSTSVTRDQTVENFLGGTVPNPFQGLMPDAPGSNGATIARNRLLRPFPQFGDIFVETYDGTVTYNAALLRLEKRFSKSSAVMLNYTYSHLTEQTSPLAAGDPPERRLSPFDRPRRFVAAGVLQLPFGNGRRWGSSWSGAKEAVLGGWQVTANYQFQSGEPLAWTANTYWDPACGDPRKLATHWGHEGGKKLGIDVPAWDLSCFYFHDAAVQTGGVDDPVKQRNDPRINVTNNNVRTFPTVLPDFRAQSHHSLDLGLGKTFKLGNRARLEVRAEAINGLNYTIFRNTTVDRGPRAATFGFVNNPGQLIVVMRPRDIQLGAKLSF